MTDEQLTSIYQKKLSESSDMAAFVRVQCEAFHKFNVKGPKRFVEFRNDWDEVHIADDDRHLIFKLGCPWSWCIDHYLKIFNGVVYNWQPVRASIWTNY